MWANSKIVSIWESVDEPQTQSVSSSCGTTLWIGDNISCLVMSGAFATQVLDIQSAENSMSLEGLSTEDITSLEGQLVDLVREWGGSAGNISLLRELDWPDDQYWAIRDRLVDSGVLSLGKGKGGSVRVADADPEAAGDDEDASAAEPEVENRRVTEAELYEPLSGLLRDRWVKDQRFERSLVEISARQGRRETGGTWTRPDLIVVSYTTLLYVPGKHFEVVTFEVKPWDTLDVTGVYEALAHRRASTRAYLLTVVPQAELEQESSEEYIQRIQEEAKRHGVGFVIVTESDDYGTWDERVEASHHDPAPHSIHDFLSLQLSDGAKQNLQTWFR